MDELEQWCVLIDGVLAGADDVAAETVAAVREALPVYRAVAPDELHASLRLAITTVLTAARDRRHDLDDAELEVLADGGRHRAAAGVPAEEMLLAWRIGFQVVLAHARTVGTRIGVDPTQMLEVLQSLIAWSDRGMVVVAAAHHDAALGRARAEQETRSDFVRGVLLGTLAPHELAAGAAQLGLDAAHDYVAVRAAVPAGMTVAEVRRVAGFGETVGATRGQTTLIDGDVAGFLPELGSRAATVTIGAGRRGRWIGSPSRSPPRPGRCTPREHSAGPASSASRRSGCCRPSSPTARSARSSWRATSRR